MPERKNEHVGKAAPRWNVQPLRTLEADIYPTPPTESLRKGREAVEGLIDAAAQIRESVPVAEATDGDDGSLDQALAMANDLGAEVAASHDELEHLRRIADAAWQARRVLNLNIASLSPVDPTAAKNLSDLLNDLSDVMPLAEEGKDWLEAAEATDGDS
jgi:hypothetical protein